MAFRAGEVYFEFLADKRPILKAADEVTRDMNRKGKGAAQNFNDGFDANRTGYQIGQSLGAGFDVGVKGFKKALAATTLLATGALAAGAAFSGAFKVAIGVADDLETFSQQANIGVESLQELRFAANRFDVELNVLNQGLLDFNARIGEFKETGGKGPAAEAFKTLGIGASILNGELQTTEDVFNAVIMKMERIEDPTRRAYLAMKLFGEEAGRKMVTMLSSGTASMEDMRAEARRLGIVMDEVDVAKAAELNERFEMMADVVKGNLTRALVELAPEIEALMDDLADFIPTLVEWGGKLIELFGGINENLIDARYNIARIKGDDEGMSQARYDRFRQLDPQEQLSTADSWIEQKLAEIEKTEKKLANQAQHGFRTDKTQDSLKKQNEELKNLFRIRQNALLRIQKQEEDAAARKARADAKANGSGSGLSSPDMGAGSTGTSSTSKITDEMREAERIFKSTRTAAEEYAMALEAIAIIESNPLTLEMAGGKEGIERYRIAKIVEYAAATQDAAGAHKYLGEQVALGNVSLENAALTMRQINSETGVYAQQAERIAQISERNTDARRDTADATREERLALLDKVEAQGLEIEQKLILARLNGNTAEIERLERENELIREKYRLIREGADEGEATREAGEIVEDRDIAEMKGEFRAAFKDGFKAAIDGDFKEFLADKLSQAADHMFDKALDNLFDALFSFQKGDGGLIDLGGILGGLGKGGNNGDGGIWQVAAQAFAGMFDQGGYMKAGEWGIVGERGPELVKSLPGGTQIIGRQATAARIQGMTASLPSLSMPTPMSGSYGPRQGGNMNIINNFNGFTSEELRQELNRRDASLKQEMPSVMGKHNDRVRRAKI